ncbi:MULTISPECIES: hypothetical protein [unclassified Bradyrhizobium]|uniref:hypothetical protein n=1 Tax=unclassified Bradyrhizobium TaxID=2631580 RepID=UPI0028F001F1|nr:MULTISPECIES: hypothetical protein [unclassified Bradyrhizobium]
MIGADVWLSRSHELIAGLADAGLPTGTGEHLKVLRLLQLLEERGESPATLDETVRYIAPVICSRSDQIDALRGVLASHLFADDIGSTNKRVVARNGIRSLGVEWAILVAVAFAFSVVGVLINFIAPMTYFYLLQGVELIRKVGWESRTNTASPELASGITPLNIATTLLTVFAIFLIWRRVRAAVRHGPVSRDGRPKHVSIAGPEDDTDNPQLLRAARLLNRPQHRPTKTLDVPATVRATAEAGGRFSPTSLIRRIPANWMLLVERGGPQDPMPEFGERLSLVLARSGVRHTVYEFRRSPNWVRRKSSRDGARGLNMSLERALGADRPTRVLVLAEAGNVIDKRTGGPARWLTDYDLPTPIVLTPNRTENWGAAEASATRAGILVLPADPDGLTSLAHRVQLDDPGPTSVSSAKEIQFERWQAERFTWLSQTKPEPAARAELLRIIRSLLAPKEFRLLVGVAAFPEVRLDLMSTLDRYLHPVDLASEQRSRLLAIGRLVWLKESFIPDWLREDLMGASSAREMRGLREAWTALLTKIPAPDEQRSTLEIHFAADGLASGARADGLFLDFMRGKYDLPAPLRWGGLAALWRAPDRTELLVAALGVLLVIGALFAEVEVGAYLELALRGWYRFIARAKDLLPWSTAWLISAASLPVVSATVWFGIVLRGNVKPSGFPRHALAATIAGLLTLAAGWLTVGSATDFRLSSAILDFAGPLVLAVSVVLLILRPLRPPKQAVQGLQDLVQTGRGTGLYDLATMLALLWLFCAGVILGTLVPSYTGWSPHAAAWCVALATLGFMRAALISASGAGLQSSSPPPSPIWRDAAVGLVLGQASGAQLAWMLLQNVPAWSLEQQASHFGAWYLALGFMLFGSAVGFSAALRTHGIVNHIGGYALCSIPLLQGIVAATTFALLGPEYQYSPFALLVGLFPSLLAGLIIPFVLARRTADRPGVLVALLVLSLPGFIVFALTFVGYVPSGIFEWIIPLPLVAAVAATWPLIQRLVTNEPSVTNEAGEWRPRPVSTWLWVCAPLVWLTVVQFSAGPVVIDLPSLAVPLSIVLAWRFGLRGFRTAVLIELAAFWYYVPDLFTLALLAPLEIFLPAKSQYGLPPWVATITLDVAATVLFIALLVSRPSLFRRIRATSQLPRWSVVVLILLLCFQAGKSDRQAAQKQTAKIHFEESRPGAQNSTIMKAELRDLIVLVADEPRSSKPPQRRPNNAGFDRPVDRQQGNNNASGPSDALQTDKNIERQNLPDGGNNPNRPVDKIPDAEFNRPVDRLHDNNSGLNEVDSPQTPDADGPAGQGRSESGAINETLSASAERASDLNRPSGPASSFGLKAPLGWSPGTLAVLVLFLLAISGVRKRAYIVVSAVFASGVASGALWLAGVGPMSFSPLSFGAAAGALAAYSVGRYFDRVSLIIPGTERAVPSGLPMPRFKVLDYTVVFGLVLLASLLSIDRFAPMNLSDQTFTDTRAAVFALTMLLSWVVGVRSGTNRSRVALIGAALFTINAMSWLGVLMFTSRAAMLLGPLLPLMVFIVGINCGNALFKPMEAMAVGQSGPLSNSWLASARRWFTPMADYADRVLGLARDRLNSMTSPIQLQESSDPSNTAAVSRGTIAGQAIVAAIAAASSRSSEAIQNETRPVSPNNPCPFLRALVAGGYVDDHVVPVATLARIIARAGGSDSLGTRVNSYVVALIGNGLSPRRLLRTGWYGVELDSLRNGPLDKQGVGSRILDGQANVEEAELDRLASFARQCRDTGGSLELGLRRGDLERYIAANIERTKDRVRWYDSLLMKGEFPALFDLMQKEGHTPYLSVDEVRTLFVERRLPDRISERLKVMRRVEALGRIRS